MRTPRVVTQHDEGLVMYCGIACEVWHDVHDGRRLLVASYSRRGERLTPLSAYVPLGARDGTDATLLALAELWQLANRIKPDEAAAMVEVAKGWIDHRERAKTAAARLAEAPGDAG